MAAPGSIPPATSAITGHQDGGPPGLSIEGVALADIDVRLTPKQGTLKKSEPWTSPDDARLEDVTARFVEFGHPLEQVTAEGVLGGRQRRP